MSWPNSWQVQPGYAGYATAAPPPTMAPAAVAPAGYSAMTPDQYAQWQQWQQYQQQYAQWHAQYGEQYARQMGKPLPAVPAPMPMQHMGIATNVPPPAAVVTQSIPAPVMPPIVTVAAAVVAPPMPTTVAPPPPPEPHPDTVAAKAPAPPPPATDDSEQEQKTAEELAFDEQFRKWEEEFDNWKRKNANHPDKNAYREYENKFVECRKKLLERRDQLRKKRLSEIASASSATSVVSTGGYNYNQPPPPPPPEEEAGMDVGLFKNALGGGGTSGGGIPGLDLINEEDKPAKQIDEDVMEVINLDDENEEKPNLEPLKEKQDNAKLPANPVNALASLLKDPKVSALLNVISGTNNGQGVNLASLGSHELLQQIQSAAGAVINANQNGNSGQDPINQAKMRGPGAHTPLSDDRSRTSFHDDRPSVVSIDDRSHDFDDFNRGQPPKRNSLEFNQRPPPNRGNTFGFDASIPPPLMDIDLSRPPPLIGSQPVSRPTRSDQPSPTPSSSSSTGRQRQSRWGGGNRDIKQEPHLEPINQPEPIQNDYRKPPPVKEEPFNGSDCPPPGEIWNYYDGHQEELQIDPELGTPCAVPKPEWMEEEEYEEIYDRYEDIEVFEERKFKMELAIKLLKQKKDNERQKAASNIQPARSGDNNNTSSGGGSRWQGGMPKPLKEEPGQKRVNPFASEDNYFRPKQVIDYSNGTPQVFDYGHSSTGPVAKDVDARVDDRNDWRSGNKRVDRDSSSDPFAKDADLRRVDDRDDWRSGNKRGDRDSSSGPFVKDADLRRVDDRDDWRSGNKRSGPDSSSGPFAKDADLRRLDDSDDWRSGNKRSGPDSSSGPFAKDADLRRVDDRDDWRSANKRGDRDSSSGPFEKDADLRRMDDRDDWRSGNMRGDRDEREPFQSGTRGGRGRFPNEDFQQPPPPVPQRFDYNHAPPSFAANELPPFMPDRPPHYSVNSAGRLATLHDNPHPDESNPCYPSKFILMNDNRPNRPSTKRGKRASSIRKQKLREHHDQQFSDNDHGDIDERQIIPPAFGSNSAPVVPRPSDYELDMKRGSEESEDSKSTYYLPPAPIVSIDDLLLPPGRFKRPQRICFIMRGIPGSGKSYLARMIKDCEVKNGGQAPRVLSIDDYFLVEKEEREPDPMTGRPILVTKSEYEFDAEMEEEYMKNLIKAFKRTITEGLYNFIIVDSVNERLEYYNEFHNFGRSNGFKVYTCTLQTELDMCIEQNIHKRAVEDIRAYANRWALCPNDHAQINASSLFNPEENEPPQPTDMDLCTEEDDEFLLVQTVVDQPPLDEEANDALQDVEDDSNLDGPELGFFASKWDADTSEQNLARLDGISKPPRRPPTIEDFLQLEGDDLGDARPGGASSGKKRVRWADIEERKTQHKMRRMGFVVGVTDWSRMMDPTGGSRALTKTKYIERVHRH